MGFQVDNFDDTGDFQNVSEDGHAAVISGIFDCGLQRPYSDDQPPRQACAIVFTVAEENDHGEKLTIQMPANVTLRSDKAKLRKVLLAAIPDFIKRTPEERKKFNAGELVGKNVFINVIHKEKDDGSIRAKVESVSKLPSAMTPVEGWVEHTEPFGLASHMIENQLGDVPTF